jgi:hypothetical protein
MLLKLTLNRMYVFWIAVVAQERVDGGGPVALDVDPHPLVNGHGTDLQALQEVDLDVPLGEAVVSLEAYR